VALAQSKSLAISGIAMSGTDPRKLSPQPVSWLMVPERD